MERFSRMEQLIGIDNAEKLYRSKVIVFGLGGVGGYVVEALTRAGIGNLLIVDGDVIAESNINRQLIALSSTIGQNKVDAYKTRITDINPKAKVETLNMFYKAENAREISFDGYDYIIDAIDTISSKIEIIKRAKLAGVPVISAMGAGNKLYADFIIKDIAETNVCPLARVMRRELKKLGITGVKAAFSKESPVRTEYSLPDNAKIIPSSISFVPSVMGLMIAGEVIRDLIGNQ